MTTIVESPRIDISRCDTEPIHILGHVQPHGALLACSAGGHTITHASRNAAQVLNLAGGTLIGAGIANAIGADAYNKIRAALDQCPAGSSHPGRVFGLKLGSSEGFWDVSVHGYAGSAIYEFEPASASAPATPLDMVRIILQELQQTKSLRELCDQTAHLVRRLIGFDRVMVYRFLEDGAGHVIAESRAAELEPLINLRYPASDIPSQARELYKRNWIRLIGDVHAVPSPIDAAPDAARTPLDLSYSALRSVSPVHIEYLRNMKVGASMSISIIVGGELWGLIACHHMKPRYVAANVRAAGELLGQVFSLQIQTVEGIEAYVTMRAARALLDRIVAEFPVDGDLIENLAQRLDPLSAFINSDGAGIWIDGTWRSTGISVPMTEIAPLAAFVSAQRADEVFSTQRLGDVYPRCNDWPGEICGVMAVPLSRINGDFLFFFRKEVAQTVDWGGNPEKPVLSSDQSDRLSPRKSFEIWREEVRGQSLPWTSRERLIADTLRMYLLDVIVRLSDVILDERRKSQQRTKFVTHELNTRVKGTLELIQSLVARGHEETSIPNYVRSLEGRIGAISLAHEAIASRDGSQIRELFLSPFAARSSLLEQIEVHGPDIELDPKAYTVLALVVHELATNAIKYGALAGPQGQVSVRWMKDKTGSLAIFWEEASGTPVRAATREGLGLNIIRRNIPHALDGEAEVVFSRNGLSARLVVPSRYIVSPPLLADRAASRFPIVESRRPLEGFSLIVLDDQMLTAMDLQAGLVKFGAVAVEIFGTAAKALDAIAQSAPDAAALDLDLDGETSVFVADELDRQGIPFVFMASELERRTIPPRFDDVPVAIKPCSVEAIALQLREALMPSLIRAVLTKLV